jgi:hypothetical protein
MSSRREQILAHIATTLGSTAGITTVYRSRMEAFSRDEAPAMVVEPIAEPPPREISTCKLDWTLQVAVVVHTRGAVSDTLADPIIVSAHSLLMADRTLGGLAINIMPAGTDWQRDKADLASLWMVNSYEVRYRTAAADLEAA